MSEQIQPLETDLKQSVTESKPVLSAEGIAFEIQHPVESESDLKSNIEKYKDFHPAAIPRSINSNELKSLLTRSKLVYEVTQLQKKLGIYTLDRFLREGSNYSSLVCSPGSDIENRCIIWCTNLYLGLNRNSDVLKKTELSLKKYGTGSGTSAVSGGNSQLHYELEEKLANFLGKEAAVLFPTGFTANLGTISAIANTHDLIIFDKECHSSIIEGIKLSGAKFHSFRNNDVNHLKIVLEKSKLNDYHNVFVVTESVFGMSGEEAPLDKYCELKKEYGFYLYVDEAHSCGFYGNNKKGLSEKLGCMDDVDFFMSTLSKSFGSVGGFIGCKKELATFIRNSSNAYLFQASSPANTVMASLAALDIIQNNNELQKKLWENTHLFRGQLVSMGFNVGNSTSPIVPIYISDEKILADMCKALFENGIFTNWISYPAVKKGKGRLRFIVSAGHIQEQIKITLDILNKVGHQFKVI